MDKLLKADPVYDHFSENQYLDCYKEPLVKTGCVDHIIPFKHSNSIRGEKMDHLRPDHGKNYPYSNRNKIARETLGKNGLKSSILNPYENSKGVPSFFELNSPTDVGKNRTSKSHSKSPELSPDRLYPKAPPKLALEKLKDTVPILEDMKEVCPSTNEMSYPVGSSRLSLSKPNKASKIFRRRDKKYVNDEEKIDSLIQTYFK
jgi:hypothetical protein